MNEDKLLGSLLKLIRVLQGQMVQGIKEQDIGLAIMQVRSLKIISKHKNCTSQLIAEILSRDKAQITRLVKELLEQKLVYKEVNPNDNRSHFLMLTDKGCKLIELLKLSEHQAVKLMTRGIDEKQLEKFIDVIQLMTENLKL